MSWARAARSSVLELARAELASQVARRRIDAAATASPAAPASSRHRRRLSRRPAAPRCAQPQPPVASSGAAAAARRARARRSGCRKSIESAEKSIQQLKELEGELSRLRTRRRAHHLRIRRPTAETLRPQLAEVKSQIEKLGPPPAKDQPPESATVAAERARLNAMAAALDGAVKTTELAWVRAKQLIDRITVIRYQHVHAQPVRAARQSRAARRLARCRLAHGHASSGALALLRRRLADMGGAQEQPSCRHSVSPCCWRSVLCGCWSRRHASRRHLRAAGAVARRSSSAPSRPPGSRRAHAGAGASCGTHCSMPDLTASICCSRLGRAWPSPCSTGC